MVCELTLSLASQEHYILFSIVADVWWLSDLDLRSTHSVPGSGDG